MKAACHPGPELARRAEEVGPTREPTEVSIMWKSRYLGLGAMLLTTGPLWAHGVGTGGPAVLDWHTAEVRRVVSGSYSWNNLGVTALGTAGEVVTVDGRRCLRGTQFDLDVANEYAFDIDETVTLRLEVHRPNGNPLYVAYDKNGGFGHEVVELPEQRRGGLHTVTLSLPRARFIDRGDYGTDLMIAGQSSPFGFLVQPQPLTICDVEVERSYETQAPAAHGWLDLTVVDQTGSPMPLRIGLYDESGRMPIPSSGAVQIKKFDDRTRTYLLRAQTVWPAENKYVFYIDGHYRARVPAGRYRLVGGRGIEYRTVDEELIVEAGETVAKTVTLERWADQPSAGWYSGDVHIHYARRDHADGRAMQLQAQAEDLHVANLLEMGNVANTHFSQLGWGHEGGRLVDAVYAVVSGQEDPRTSHRGHTIHLNLTSPLRFPDEYLLYHKVFEGVAEQGGLSGYAHVGGAFGGTLPGLALEGAFDLIDFVEIAQNGGIGTNYWFDLLNLGLRVSPAAGTDYPYLDHPGAVRNYVHLPDGYTVDGWFAGLEGGRTFVTTGPLLSFSANGVGMGKEIRVGAAETITLSGEARLNPDIDSLDRLELIEQGEVVASQQATSGESIRLDHRAMASRSTWFVVRAVGRRTVPNGAISAVSAPIYVVVDGQERAWNREAVPGIVERFVTALDGLQGSSLESAGEQEWWESGPVWQRTWSRQISALNSRIDAARSRLRNLARQARSDN